MSIIILISDFDGTFVGTDSVDFSQAHRLSPELLSLVKNQAQAFAGFYICTSRHFEGVNKFYANYASSDVKFQNELALKDLKGKTHKIDFDEFISALPTVAAQNFTKETNVPFFGCSTLDDVTLEGNAQCGKVFNDYHKPHEEKMLATLDLDTKSITLQTPEAIKGKMRSIYNPSKNPQLDQIIADAQARYPNECIRFVFVDDKYAICSAAYNKYAHCMEVYHSTKNGLVSLNEVMAVRNSFEILANPNLARFRHFKPYSNYVMESPRGIDVSDEGNAITDTQETMPK